MATLKKIQAGIYETPDGAYRVIKDGYEPVRDSEKDGRPVYFDSLHLGAEEVCWIIIDVASDTNVAITDTLREARQRIPHHDS